MDITSYLLGKKNSSGGSNIQTSKNVSYNSNGDYSVTADEGYDAIRTTNVTVNVTPNLQTKSETITQNNTTTTISKDSGYDGMNEVNITTNVANDPNWSSLGYNGTPDTVQTWITYAESIQQNWDSSQTNLTEKFKADNNIVIMPLVDTSNATNFSGMFKGCRRLASFPAFNSSNVTNFSSMFASNNSSSGYGNYMMQTATLMDTSSGTNFGAMFSECDLLKNVPLYDTSNGTNFGNMFSRCKSLKSIPQFNMSKATSVGYMFYMASKLETVPELDWGRVTSLGTETFLQCSNLTNLGGFKDLGKAYSTSMSANYGPYTLSLSASSKITHDSLMNVINDLYDIAAKGCATQKLTIGSTNMAKLTAEEIAIATNKGWTVS